MGATSGVLSFKLGGVVHRTSPTSDIQNGGDSGGGPRLAFTAFNSFRPSWHPQPHDFHARHSSCAPRPHVTERPALSRGALSLLSAIRQENLTEFVAGQLQPARSLVPDVLSVLDNIGCVGHFLLALVADVLNHSGLPATAEPARRPCRTRRRLRRLRP